MKKYIKGSVEKFKSDVLSKAIYDFCKWGVGLLALVGSTRWIPWFKHITLLEYKVSLYVICLSCIITLTIGFTISSFIYKKKLRLIQNDNYLDDQTGLKNYKALELYLPQLIDESKKNKSSFSIVLIDIDDFKKFNDTYGYNTADLILKKVGELLGSEKRSTDETFRKFQRGDEFVIILKETSLSDAYTAAERRRKLINSTSFNIGKEQYKITVSSGVTEFKSESDDQSSIFDRVSLALSNAKKIKNKNNTNSII